MHKYLGIVIVATSIGFPAFAQSFDPDNGTGNLVTAITVAPAPAGSTIVSGRSGVEAYAMSARKKVNSGALDNSDPANLDNGHTGGGSAGYNEMLRNW
ncbi:MAG TPA: hypothetical protein VIV34_10465 [Pseudolabrys sp.]